VFPEGVSADERFGCVYSISVLEHLSVTRSTKSRAALGAPRGGRLPIHATITSSSARGRRLPRWLAAVTTSPHPERSSTSCSRSRCRPGDVLRPRATPLARTFRTTSFRCDAASRSSSASRRARTADERGPRRRHRRYAVARCSRRAWALRDHPRCVRCTSGLSTTIRRRHRRDARSAPASR
jgi:hypothetical protein